MRALGVLLSLLAWVGLANAAPPAQMLASIYRDGVHVADYWVSEKLDGVRGRWDGAAMWTRGGHRIDLPAWFVAGWPEVAMEGELWIARGRFDEVSSLVRQQGRHRAEWRQVRFMVFDLPGHTGTFDARLRRMRALLDAAGVAWLQPVPQRRVADAQSLEAWMRDVVAAGGEGLMLHRAAGLYRDGRSGDVLKYKPHDDAEARVVAYTDGKGKYAGMVGALVVERGDGVRFRIGSGLTDAQRASPPAIGSLVTYRYNGLTANGLPRFARFLRVRDDAPADAAGPR